MKKLLQALIITGLLLAVSAIVCGCQSEKSQAPTSSDVASVIQQTSEIDSKSEPSQNIDKLNIEEEVMPEIAIHQNVRGEGDSAFYGFHYEKVGTIPIEIELLLENDYAKEIWEEYCKWSDDNDNPYYNKYDPYNIYDKPNLPNIVRKYSIDHDKVVEILNKRRENFEKSQEKYGASNKGANLIYTDEEIEAIASGNVEKCFNLFTYNTAILKNDLIYTPAYIYNNTMDKLEEAGITAEEIAARTEIYGSFSLTDEQMTALQNKMLKYVALRAEKGNFSGTYEIPATATFSVPEKIGNATFVKQA